MVEAEPAGGIRWLQWLRNAVLSLFVAALCAGIFVPIYTDEVGWRFHERAGLDGVDKMFSDICGPHTLAAPPFFMMPARYYSALFNTAFADPFYVRLSGVLYALAWLVLLLVLIRRLADSARDRVPLSLVAVGLMSLGVLPMLLVWSRPEQAIVLAATAALALTWKNGRELSAETDARAAWLRSTAILLLAIFAFSYHTKALVLAPLFLACLFFASRGRQANAPRLAVGAILVAVAAVSARYWINRLQCPDDPILFAMYAQNNAGVEITRSRNLSEVVSALGKTIGNITLLDYFGMAAPRANPFYDWLAANQISSANSYLWYRALIVTWWGAVLLACICIVVRLKQGWTKRRLDARPVMSIVLLGVVLGWSATQGVRNIYESIFVLPLVMLAVVFALSASGNGDRISKATRILAVFLGAFALVSVPIMAATFGPSLARASEQRGFIAAQPRSLPVFGHASLKPDVLGAARLCGIPEPAQAQGLLIDDLTYFAFMESRLPQHELGVLSVWRGTIRDPLAYLRSRKSDGAILRCAFLPPELRAQARSKGQFCCLPAPR